MKYDTFDIKFKIDSVKEFLKLKAEGLTIGYGKYAKSINVKKTTFISWVQKYQENKLNYSEFNNSHQSLMVVNANNNDFINLCEDTFEVVDTNGNINDVDTMFKDNKLIPNKNMSLKINGGVIEFDSSCLKKVIEALKSC